MQHKLDTLRERLKEVSYLQSTYALLGWDQQVMMPKGAAPYRAEILGYIGTEIHNKFVRLDDGNVLSDLVTASKKRELSERDSRMVEELWHDFEKEKKLPAAHVAELEALRSASQHAWEGAKAKGDFSKVAPYLEKMVAVFKRQAEYLGYPDHPYDALLDYYESGLTTAGVTGILEEVKAFLIPFIRKIRKEGEKVTESKIFGSYDVDAQVAFSNELSKQMGFNFHMGRLDKSTHPFSEGFHPTDVRMTTRFSERDVRESISGTMHETGHSLDEQGLPEDYRGTPLGAARSFGVHESQSRLWENNLGKSKAFLTYLYPRILKAFPKSHKKLPQNELYRSWNAVTPSLIRVAADEVTYNLHIIIRFELEKALIEGSLKVKDLPKAWNAKYKEYLGVNVPNNTKGVMQDIHWYCGYFGYFPTYTLGNLYAAQLYHAINKKVPKLDQKLAKGDCKAVKEWLNTHIHRHGRYYSVEELMRQATGEAPTGRYFIDYIREKYGAIYKLY
jgi:carboxypeptidase Taq